MEAAPLTLAQTHARNAALETKRANPVAASEEHDLAAAEFAAAALLTKDSEALRILHLLEQHHKRLGQILKSRHTTNIQEQSHDIVSGKEALKSSSPPLPDHPRSQSPDTVLQPPRLVHTGRPTARDLSSSIASNLASARGIPNNRQKRSIPISPLVSNQHADGRFSQEDDVRDTNPSRRNPQSATGRGVNSAPRPSWAPPPAVSESNPSTSGADTADSTALDAPFQQFYSTFESLISKLSAPLAFAGLPLTTPNSPSTTLTATKPQPSTSEPPPAKQPEASIDYSQLISRAALRAVSRNDKSSPHGNPAESFYVVPTTGGTTSYAEIMTRADREASHHRRNISNFSTGTADFFEDASSTILPPVASTIQPTRPGLSTERKHNGKTMEELNLENKALKHLSDTLSKRLHVFEMSAQTSSAALAQSIRSLHLSPLNTPENSRGKSTTMIGLNTDSPHGITPLSSTGVEAAKLKSRVAELEEILRKSDAKARKREEENMKLRDTLGKYREKWDSLKAGAKARRERVAGEAVGSAKDKGRDQDRDSNAMEKDDDDRPGEGTL